MTMETDMAALPGITAEEAERAARPLAEAWTLPPAAYLRDDIYDLEVERIFRRSWLPVARVDQVREPGDFLTIDLVGQPVLVVRGADGQVRVMSNVCLHRAAPIAEGTGRRKLFTCPYHSWGYDTEGRLVAAPLMDGVKGFTPKDCRLPQVRTEVWEGFVMANLDPEAAPFAPQVAGLSRYFANYRLADMVVARTLSYDSDWNWKVLVENFMEAYHHIGIHPQTFEPTFHARDSKVEDADGPWAILHMPAADPDAPHAGLVQGLEPWQAGALFAAVAFPHFLIAPHANGLAWYQVLPQGAGRMRLNVHVCVPAAARAMPAYEGLVEASAAFTDHVHQEDIAANDLVWRGLNAPMTRQGRLSPLEKAIWQMNRWWLGRLGALS
jgi:phenylpropionate dioxygenase-like ring-hydroxylating dioxygenase large terminal subunit